MMRETIEEKLRMGFEPLHLEVMDESHRHNVPIGAESHFNVVVVSDKFAGKRVIGRHRAVYAVLAEELANSVHALALHTYTEKEWATLQNTVPPSPPCGGGGIRS
ncbi:transcriptional regulator BolA [Pectobacterium cacticida]|uniref:Transcriptional regulator BolA n=1 Tax=Pectobacterium cacticida TaxID=69221 RepID=A0ABZ2G8H4_9GAMM|nr:transcriptional regulator BolA [Pectobacterium cacticida]UYX07680.1 transcriptional regulator BolA [Pectobacterium cacticida]